LVNQRFGFFRKLEHLNNQEIENKSIKLVKIYQNYTDGNLGNELIQFKEPYKVFKNEISVSNSFSQEHLMYKVLFNKGVKNGLPNVEIVLRIYFVLMISNCSSERSISNLKYI